MTKAERVILSEMWSDHTITKKTIAKVLGIDIPTLIVTARKMRLPEVRGCNPGRGPEVCDPTPEEIEQRAIGLRAGWKSDRLQWRRRVLTHKG